MVFDEKFDLIFSLGEDCACTSYLRRFNLQENSYPFDWLTKADFFTRVDLLANDFRGFLEKENLVWLDKSAWKGSVDEHNDYYWDKGTDFYFYHDFAAQTPFDEAFAVVRQRYDRRIERLYERIRGAKKVLLVWWSRDKHQDFEAVKQAYERLCEKFSHAKIYMLLIEFGEQSQRIYNRAGGELCLLRYDNISYKHNPAYNETMGNEANNAAVFAKIQKRKDLKAHLYSCVFRFGRFCLNFLPTKTRQKLKDKWRFYFFRDKL